MKKKGAKAPKKINKKGSLKPAKKKTIKQSKPKNAKKTIKKVLKKEIKKNKKETSPIELFEETIVTCANCGKTMRLLKAPEFNTEGMLCQACLKGEIDIPQE